MQAITIYNTKDSHYKVLIKLRLILDFNESDTEYDVLMNFLHYLIVIKAIFKTILIIKDFLSRIILSLLVFGLLITYSEAVIISLP